MTVLVTSETDKLAKERLARLVRNLRGQKTQREFAKLLGTSYTAVQDWEKQIRLPKGKNLGRIAQLQGWTQEDLMRYLFLPDVHMVPSAVDPLELVMMDIQNLSPEQLRKLSVYLNAKLNQSQDDDIKMSLSDLTAQQKHNLHLLLRASLRDQSPTEAMGRVGIDPALFTDIFLRNNKNRVVDHASLDQLSGLCCRVIRWRSGQLPEIDCHQTYLGETALLIDALAEQAIIDQP
jgi:transcriptional regulator with XRE-family HTH domain